MRFVEMREHVAVPLLRPIELRQLFGDVGLEQQVLALLRALAGAPEVFRSPDVIPALAGDDADVSEHLAAPRWRDLARESEQRLDTLLSFVEAAGCDAKLNLIERN